MDEEMIRPLEGMLVVEFGQLIAGPNAGMILSSYGADVIKIEPPGGDPGRGLQSRPVEGAITPPAVAYNQGKQSIVLDLKQPDGVALARRLVARADVVIESSRPGAMDRLGLGSDDCLGLNPGLIYASVSAFGRTGPERQRGGVDIVIQAESGIMSVTGDAGGDPLKVGFQLVDVATGHVLAQAILAAIVQRERGGAGQALEVALIDVALHLQAGGFAEYLATQQIPTRVGNSAPQTAPSDLFETADGEMVVTGYLPVHWEALCKIVGLTELIGDPRFTTKLDRVLHRDELYAILQDTFRSRTTAHWLDDLTAAGIPAGAVKSYADVVASEQAGARGWIATVTDSAGNEHKAVRLPPRFTAWTPEPRIGPPLAGEHTRAILEQLDVAPDDVERLLADGIVAQADRSSSS